MCVIVYCPQGERPAFDELLTMSNANPHGIGVAWRTSDRVHYVKGISLNRLVGYLDKPGELIIHFRYASVGGVSPELCHPFPVRVDAPLHLRGKTSAVIFTNGTWQNWSAINETISRRLNLPPLQGEVSDTRVIARLVKATGATRWLTQIKDTNRNESTVRSLIFDRHKTRIFGDWREQDGIFFSNLRWDRPRAFPFFDGRHLPPARPTSPARIYVGPDGTLAIPEDFDDDELPF